MHVLHVSIENQRAWGSDAGHGLPFYASWIHSLPTERDFHHSRVRMPFGPLPVIPYNSGCNAMLDKPLAEEQKAGF